MEGLKLMSLEVQKCKSQFMERDRGHEDNRTKRPQVKEDLGMQRTGTPKVLQTYRDEDMENRGQKWKGVSLYDVGKVT